jgi:putative MATE family efflux protein
MEETPSSNQQTTVQTDKRILLMRDAPPVKAIFKMTLPVIAGMMVNILYNQMNYIFIGMLRDPYQLAAVSVSLPVFIATMAVASLVGTGGSSWLTRCLGAGHKDKAEQTLAVCMLLIVGFGVLMTIFGLIFADALPNMLGATEFSHDFTRQYITVLIIGSVFSISNFAIGQLIRAEGSVMPSMIGMLAGLLLSIGLTPLFLFVFNMNVMGAALSTVIGNAVSALYFLGCYLRKKTVIRLTFSHLSLKFSKNKEILWQIFSIGVPALLGQMLVSISQMLANNIANTYGDVHIASLGVALQIMTIGTFVFMGFSAGCQPIMGYNFGEGNFERLIRLLKTALAVSASIGLVVGLALFIFAQPFANLFSPVEEVQTLTAQVLRALVLSMPFMGGVTLCSVVFKAIGKPLHALIVTVSRQGLIYLPLLFIFNGIWGFTGMIYSQPLTDLVMFIASAAFLLQVVKVLGKRTSKALQR